MIRHDHDASSRLGCRLLLGVAVVALLSGPAWAAPVLSVTATDNGSPLVFVPAVNLPGDLAGSFIDSNFSQITVDLTGVPAVSSPDLGTVVLQVSGAGGGTHVIDLVATQSGLTEPAGFNGALTQTFNNLIGGAGPVTEDFMVNGSVTNSHTFLATPPRADTAMFTDPNLPAITSNAQEFIATFNAAGQDLELTQEFQAASVVSEPTSLVMLGMGLLGLGFVKKWSRREMTRACVLPVI